MPHRTLLAVVVVVALLTGSPPALHDRGAGPVVASGGAARGLTSDVRAAPSEASTAAIPDSTEVRLTLTLGFANASRLATLLSDLENPSSPRYRAFLSSTEFVRDFAPPEAEVAAVESTLEGSGARAVTLSPAGIGVTGVLTPQQIHRLLGVTLVNLGGGPSYTTLGSPVLPAALRGLVVGVGGLSDLVTANPGLSTPAASPWPVDRRSGSDQFVQSNLPDSDWFVGSDYAQAYRATSLWPGNATVPDATFPTGVAIATLLASGYSATSGTNLPPWDPTVLSAYFNDTLSKTWPMPTLTGEPVILAGGSAPPAPGSFEGVNDSTLDESENSLDLEMAGSLAPGASLYNFYFPGSALYSPILVGDAADDFATDLGAALNHDYSPQNLSVVSASFGLPEVNDSLWDSYLAEAAATGVTVVAASGDQGNAPDFLTGRSDGQWPIWPSTAAFNTSGAISAGGVSVSLDGSPTSVFDGKVLNATFDPTVSGIASQSVWFDQTRGPGAYAGSEGGASALFGEPWWQYHSAAQPAIANATFVEGLSSLGRATPDLALPGNDTIVYDFANKTGTVFADVLEGTSVAAPVLAGLLADVVAVESQQKGSFAGLGYIDPEIYRIASYYQALPGPDDPFVDVTNGSNFVYSALPGWDAATGWGGLNVSRFLAADENATVRNYSYTGPTPGLPPRSGSSPGLPLVELAILGGIVVAAVILVAVFSRRPRFATPPPPPPYAPPASAGAVSFGPPALAVGGPPAALYCGFCGAVRPPGSLRCPRCGAG
jgi:subtilase family serine protease